VTGAGVSDPENLTEDGATGEVPADERPLVRFRVTENVALLYLADPPGNALSAPMREALSRRLDEIERRARIEAVVLMAEGSVFSVAMPAGPETVDGPADAPGMAALCARIEAMPIPVIAVLQGAAMGSGADLAFACHIRIATRSARIGFPDIAVGLPPEGGATQRLPRLAGVGIALRLLLTGRPVTAPTALEFGLIDGLVEGDAHSAGFATARRVLDDGPRPPPARERRDQLIDGAAAMAEIARARAALGPAALFAARRISDCVEAALLLPFETGLDFEAEAHDECRAHPESLAMRALYLAERRISPALVVADDEGRRHPRPEGQAAIARLGAAQKRAIDWLLARGVAPAGIDAAFLERGFARGPMSAGGAAEPSDPETWERITGALLAEGARMIEDGTVRRAGDIDALAVHGMGWPRRLGGPMIAARIAGLAGRLRRLRDWQGQDPVWTPSVPLVDATKTADGFPT